MLLLPKDLAGHFCEGRRDDIVHGPLGEVLLLLVRVDDPNGKLVTALEAAMKVVDARLADSGSSTNTLLIGSKTPSSRRGAAKKEDPEKLRAALEAGTHFLVVLTKRNTGRDSLTSRVWVGRSPASDIVLKHWSVSQRHAWLNCDDSGAYFVGDNDSKNGTRVNGRKILGQELVDIDPGDTVAFGDVTAVMCRAKTLREAIDLAR